MSWYCLRGNTKTEASRKPVPLHKSVCDVLAEWRSALLYNSYADFLFPSLRKNGTQPLMPDMALKKFLRPALMRAGMTGKVIPCCKVLRFEHPIEKLYALIVERLDGNIWH
jgi:hypothetical protein